MAMIQPERQTRPRRLSSPCRKYGGGEVLGQQRRQAARDSRSYRITGGPLETDLNNSNTHKGREALTKHSVLVLKRSRGCRRMSTLRWSWRCLVHKAEAWR